ncbi:hypothetical protein SAT01_11360 [Sinomonas atrocyanea]|nr:hypothetical protein SAT01_11360 [Sinomonas atrocyanea]
MSDVMMDVMSSPLPSPLTETPMVVLLRSGAVPDDAAPRQGWDAEGGQAVEGLAAPPALVH